MRAHFERTVTEHFRDLQNVRFSQGNVGDLLALFHQSRTGRGRHEDRGWPENGSSIERGIVQLLARVGFRLWLHLSHGVGRLTRLLDHRLTRLGRLGGLLDLGHGLGRLGWLFNLGHRLCGFGGLFDLGYGLGWLGWFLNLGHGLGWLGGLFDLRHSPHRCIRKGRGKGREEE